MRRALFLADKSDSGLYRCSTPQRAPQRSSDVQLSVVSGFMKRETQSLNTLPSVDCWVTGRVRAASASSDENIKVTAETKHCESRQARISASIPRSPFTISSSFGLTSIQSYPPPKISDHGYYYKRTSRTRRGRSGFCFGVGRSVPTTTTLQIKRTGTQRATIYSLIALTMVTTILLIARNGAST